MIKYFLTILIFSSVSILLFQNCGNGAGYGDAYSTDVGSNGAPPPSGNDAAITAAAKNILSQSCNGCHSAQVKAGNIGPILDVSYLISVGLVKPKNSAGSQLYSSISNNRMPKGGSPLSAAQKRSIQDWINIGAPAF